ncbi:MAG: hypothetical protein ABIN97_11535, partial [Ginsengibacter sp.]
MKWLQKIIQLNKKKHCTKFCFYCLILIHFFLPAAINAQAKYSLIINLVNQDTFSVSDNAFKLQSLALQSSFNNITICSDYINSLPQILSAKGYPAASVDTLYFDSLAAHVHLFLGPQYNQVKVN